MVRLRELRRRKFMSQEDLAKAAGLAASTVTKIELGKASPRYQTARALAKALGVDPGEIEWPGIDDEAEQEADERAEAPGYLKVAEPRADWTVGSDASSKPASDGA